MNDTNSTGQPAALPGLAVATGSAKTPEPQVDENLAICPYCGKAYQVESEDYTEHDVEEECERCGKTYMRCTYFSVTHHTRPLPNTKL